MKMGDKEIETHTFGTSEETTDGSQRHQDLHGDPPDRRKRQRDGYGRWVRVGAVAEVTVSQSYPIQKDKGERFRIVEVDDDGRVVQKSADMYIRHAPGRFKIVSPPTKAEARELAKVEKGSRQ
jgi:hypothetical protein